MMHAAPVATPLLPYECAPRRLRKAMRERRDTNRPPRALPSLLCQPTDAAAPHPATARAWRLRPCLAKNLQILVLVWQRHGRRIRELALVLSDGACVDGHLGWLERRRLDKRKVGVADELPCQPEEGLLEVVVGLRRDVIVLQILLAVERDLLRLHLALLHVHLVADEDDRDVFAHAHHVAVPVG